MTCSVANIEIYIYIYSIFISIPLSTFPEDFWSTVDWVSFSVCIVGIKEAHTVFYDFAHLHPQLNTEGFSFLHSLANPISFFLWIKVLLAAVKYKTVSQLPLLLKQSIKLSGGQVYFGSTTVKKSQQQRGLKRAGDATSIPLAGAEWKNARVLWSASSFLCSIQGPAHEMMTSRERLLTLLTIT